LAVGVTTVLAIAGLCWLPSDRGATQVQPVRSVEIPKTEAPAPPPPVPLPAPRVDAVSAVLTVPKKSTPPVEAAADGSVILVERVQPLPADPVENAASVLEFEEPAARRALRHNIRLLEQGCQAFRKVPHYVARFVRQERIAGELQPPEEIELKVRHAPFSVYMHWFSVDAGRELLFVDGAGDEPMFVRLGGWKGRLLPTLSIDPNGPDARERSRYPISRAGILALAELLLENRRVDLERNVNLRCDVSENRPLNGRNCYYFCFEFAHPEESEVYRKSVQYIDSEWLVPICVQNYTWPDRGIEVSPFALDDATLIEYYSYSNINTDLQLTDADFDRENPEYRFRR